MLSGSPALCGHSPDSKSTDQTVGYENKSTQLHILLVKLLLLELQQASRPTAWGCQYYAARAGSAAQVLVPLLRHGDNHMAAAMSDFIIASGACTPTCHPCEALFVFVYFQYLAMLHVLPVVTNGT